MKTMSISIFTLLLLWFIFLLIYLFLGIHRKIKPKLSVILIVSLLVGIIYATYV